MKSTCAIVAVTLLFCNNALAAAEPSDAIGWYGTWESGLAAAQKSGQPILLVSAAPHCKNISGMW